MDEGHAFGHVIFTTPLGLQVIYNIPKRQRNSETSDDFLPVITNVPTAGDPELGAVSFPSSSRQLSSVWRAKGNNVTHLP